MSTKRRASPSSDPTTKRIKPSSSSSSSFTTAATTTKPETDSAGAPYWPLNPPTSTRRITLSTFKSQTLVNVREYYRDKDKDEMLPGKKGISLTVEQFGALVRAVPAVVAALKEDGVEVDVGGLELREVVAKGFADGEEEEMKREEEAEEKKKNYEATSSEGED